MSAELFAAALSKMKSVIRKAPTVALEPLAPLAATKKRLVRKPVADEEEIKLPGAGRDDAMRESQVADFLAKRAAYKAKKAEEAKPVVEAPKAVGGAGAPPVEEKKEEKKEAKSKKPAKAKPVVEEGTLNGAREKLGHISFAYKGKTVEGKKIAKIIADVLRSGKMREAYQNVETGLFDDPFATTEAYGGEGNENTIDDLYKAVKPLPLKVDITANSYAWYNYAAARTAYSARALSNAIEFWNDSAEERGYDTLKRTTAEFNGNMLQLKITSLEDANHDAAIWDLLAKK
jgi:hypothetical protein